MPRPETLETEFLQLLRCPSSTQPLLQHGSNLVSADGRFCYPVSNDGIPLFAQEFCGAEAASQRTHYNKIAAAYTANLGYPHTQEYLAYLDRTTLRAFGNDSPGTLVELCCGRGEALQLFGGKISRYVGVDISEKMLEATSAQLHSNRRFFVQGDATNVPLASGVADTVVMLGGIHHVPDRAALFSEVARILKPGGRFLYREPVNDFALWRAIRSVIYRISPLLNYGSERPLLFEETVPILEKAGLRSISYRTHGLFGFCLFMNSDVLVFNRLFRFIPGIRQLTRISTRIDDLMLSIPRLHRAGLQVIGVAEKCRPL